MGRGVLRRPPRDAFLLGAASTVLDVLATLLFLLATREGLLSVVAVITALYPAATVLMANVVLHEHLQTDSAATVLRLRPFRCPCWRGPPSQALAFRHAAKPRTGARR